ncbi:helix-turn-helix domain-containing protein [Roseibium limicola]|uniref:Helix-turn-helix domain-containing protein n=1 Tax=Roseibium limicola TaxID=2816037 RepID=A0A939J7F7_9HYPH|nr:helix-turn-helix domain-containing protein [Roseibium limicola]MBO0346132.1 helix-turn-helix domain-containing protein [Roseibium limicola]
MVQNPFIPRYHLYGENGPVEDFDFFHIETIPARSRSLGWSLDPHAHAHLFQILVIMEGSGRLSGESGERSIDHETAVYVPAGAVHGWTFAPGTEGYVVSFTSDYLSGGSADLSQAEQAALMCASCKVTALDPLRLRRMAFALSEMAAESNEVVERRAIFRSLLNFVLVLLFEQPASPPAADSTTGFSLVQFKGLVEENFRQQRGAEFYASEMGLSVARLNRFCRLFLDRTASQAVRDRLMLEAKRLLTFSNQSVQEIAFDLGYEDPAYFSRSFRKDIGRSPQEFRTSQSSSLTAKPD